MENKKPPTQSSRRVLSSKEQPFQMTPAPQPPQRPVMPQISLPQTHEEWHAHWKTQGQPWRTEPEIDVQRQKELAQRRTIVPDVGKGNYPFSGMKLNRADVEWLLATHDRGRGPVEWSDESQRERKGVDVRGSEMQSVNLGSLPLARLVGGFQFNEWIDATEEQRSLACVILTKADLREAQLEGADLREAQLKGADLRGAQLEGANLRDVIMGNKDSIGPYLADVQWGTINLAVVDWSQVAVLGDEDQARRKYESSGEQKRKATPLREYRAAMRANRQLSVALQGQGFNEDAARFAYRAQVLQKAVYWFQMVQEAISLHKRMRALGSWLFSWFLFLLAGYGYKPLRSFLAYVLVIAGFATAYYVFGLNDLVGPHHVPGPHYLSWYEAFVVSMTAFHGRGFFVGTFSPGDPQALVAAIEAFLGLLIEVTFIATLTQRLFSR
jgi:Pentapeptide repeats (8 copies)